MCEREQSSCNKCIDKLSKNDCHSSITILFFLLWLLFMRGKALFFAMLPNTLFHWTLISLMMMIIDEMSHPHFSLYSISEKFNKGVLPLTTWIFAWSVHVACHWQSACVHTYLFFSLWRCGVAFVELWSKALIRTWKNMMESNATSQGRRCSQMWFITSLAWMWSDVGTHDWWRSHHFVSQDFVQYTSKCAYTTRCFLNWEEMRQKANKKLLLLCNENKFWCVLLLKRQVQLKNQLHLFIVFLWEIDIIINFYY